MTGEPEWVRLVSGGHKSMAHTILVAQPNFIGVFSFSTGFMASPPKTPKTENEVFLHALYLEKKGYPEEAWAYFKRHFPEE